MGNKTKEALLEKEQSKKNTIIKLRPLNFMEYKI